MRAKMGYKCGSPAVASCFNPQCQKCAAGIKLEEPTSSSVRCTSCGIAKPRTDYSKKPDGLRWYSLCDRCRQ